MNNIYKNVKHKVGICINIINKEIVSIFLSCVVNLFLLLAITRQLPALFRTLRQEC